MAKLVRAALVLLVLYMCLLGGILYYESQQRALQAELKEDMAVLQRDMARLQLQRKCP